MSETDRLAEEIAQLRALLTPGGLPAAGPGRGGLGRYVEWRLNVGTLLTVALMIGGGILAVRDQVRDAALAAEQNAVEIRRVEGDAKGRLGELREEHRSLLIRFNRHVERGGASLIVPPETALPLMSAHRPGGSGGGR